MQTERRGSAFQSARGKRELESMFLFVTGKCNAKCAMCFYAGDMGERSSDLSFDEIKKLSQTAPPFKRLWLSGGEPTLREDLPDIIELFYKNNHITDINLPTNGIKTERILEWIGRIRTNCPKANVTISISLDGFGATHDKQRGVSCFYEAAETLRRVDERFGKDGQVLTNIATVITKYNVDEVVDFMLWVYGRFNVCTHTIEAARGVTREEGVKVLTEKSLREIQDRVVPYYVGYGDRIAAGVKGRFGKWLARFFYLGLMRSMYNIRAENLEKPAPWNMDCTAGETTLVIDYDGRFRSCELRPPLGNVKDYGCDVSAILRGPAMREEIEAIGHGYRANCWCTHGCWIMSSIVFNPGKMMSMMLKSNRETRRLNRPLAINEDVLRDLEKRYHLDTDKLGKLGIA